MPTYLQDGVGIGSGSSLIGATTAGGTLSLISTSNATLGTINIGVTNDTIYLTGNLHVNLGSDATGDMYYRDSGGAFARLPLGTTGQILSKIGAIPGWVDGLVGLTSAATYNTFLGVNAGVAATGGSNVFIGAYTGYGTTSGYLNVFVGHQSGQANTTGFDNVFLGANTGTNNTTGSNTVLIGLQAGYNHTSGDSNVFIGTQTGMAITNGQGNTAIGKLADFTGNSSYSTAIGFNAKATGNYVMALGGVDSFAVKVGIGIASPAYTLDVVGTIHSTGAVTAGGAVTAPSLATTGAITAGGALTAAGLLSASGGLALTVGSDATGDMYYRNSSGQLARVGIGSSGQVLTVASGLPTWAAGGGGISLIGITNDDPYYFTSLGVYSGTYGIKNVYIGSWAGSGDNYGSNNVYVGYNAGIYGTSGSQNTYIGTEAGTDTRNGSYNTALGNGANFLYDASYSTSIGAGAIAGASNVMALGGTGTYAVKVGIGTPTPSCELEVVGTIKATGLSLNLGGTTGDIYYQDSSGNLHRLPIGTSGQTLKVVSGLPAWV
jgi:hypothetical protein